MTTTTGGGGVGLPRRRMMPGGQALWMAGIAPVGSCEGGGEVSTARGNTGGRQLLGGDSPAAMVRAQIRRAPGHGENWNEQWRLGETRENGRGQEKGVKGP
jgi:hypothetical protein